MDTHDSSDSNEMPEDLKRKNVSGDLPEPKRSNNTSPVGTLETEVIEVSSDSNHEGAGAGPQGISDNFECSDDDSNDQLRDDAQDCLRDDHFPLETFPTELYDDRDPIYIEWDARNKNVFVISPVVVKTEDSQVTQLENYALTTVVTPWRSIRPEKGTLITKDQIVPRRVATALKDEGLFPSYIKTRNEYLNAETFLLHKEESNIHSEIYQLGNDQIEDPEISKYCPIGGKTVDKTGEELDAKERDAFSMLLEKVHESLEGPYPYKHEPRSHTLSKKCRTAISRLIPEWILRKSIVTALPVEKVESRIKNQESGNFEKVDEGYLRHPYSIFQHVNVFHMFGVSMHPNGIVNLETILPPGTCGDKLENLIFPFKPTNYAEQSANTTTYLCAFCQKKYKNLRSHYRKARHIEECPENAKLHLMLLCECGSGGQCLFHGYKQLEDHQTLLTYAPRKTEIYVCWPDTRLQNKYVYVTYDYVLQDIVTNGFEILLQKLTEGDARKNDLLIAMRESLDKYRGKVISGDHTSKGQRSVNIRTYDADTSTMTIGTPSPDYLNRRLVAPCTYYTSVLAATPLEIPEKRLSPVKKPSNPALRKPVPSTVVRSPDLLTDSDDCFFSPGPEKANVVLSPERPKTPESIETRLRDDTITTIPPVTSLEITLRTMSDSIDTSVANVSFGDEDIISKDVFMSQSAEEGDTDDSFELANTMPEVPEQPLDKEPLFPAISTPLAFGLQDHNYSSYFPEISKRPTFETLAQPEPDSESSVDEDGAFKTPKGGSPIRHSTPARIDKRATSRAISTETRDETPEIGDNDESSLENLNENSSSRRQRETEERNLARSRQQMPPPSTTSVPPSAQISSEARRGPIGDTLSDSDSSVGTGAFSGSVSLNPSISRDELYEAIQQAMSVQTPSQDRQAEIRNLRRDNVELETRNNELERERDDAQGVRDAALDVLIPESDDIDNRMDILVMKRDVATLALQQHLGTQLLNQATEIRKQIRSECQAKIQELEKQLSDAQNSERFMRDANQDLAGKTTTSKIQIEALTNTLTLTNAELNTARETIKTMKETEEVESANKWKLENDLARLSEENRKLKEEMANQARLVTQLTNDRTRLSAQIAAKDRQLESRPARLKVSQDNESGNGLYDTQGNRVIETEQKSTQKDDSDIMNVAPNAIMKSYPTADSNVTPPKFDMEDSVSLLPETDSYETETRPLSPDPQYERKNSDEIVTTGGAGLLTLQESVSRQPPEDQPNDYQQDRSPEHFAVELEPRMDPLGGENWNDDVVLRFDPLAVKMDEIRQQNAEDGLGQYVNAFYRVQMYESRCSRNEQARAKRSNTYYSQPLKDALWPLFDINKTDCTPPSDIYLDNIDEFTNEWTCQYQAYLRQEEYRDEDHLKLGYECNFEPIPEGLEHVEAVLQYEKKVPSWYRLLKSKEEIESKVSRLPQLVKQMARTKNDQNYPINSVLYEARCIRHPPNSSMIDRLLAELNWLDAGDSALLYQRTVGQNRFMGKCPKLPYPADVKDDEKSSSEFIGSPVHYLRLERLIGHTEIFAAQWVLLREYFRLFRMMIPTAISRNRKTLEEMDETDARVWINNLIVSVRTTVHVQVAKSLYVSGSELKVRDVVRQVAVCLAEHYRAMQEWKTKIFDGNFQWRKDIAHLETEVLNRRTSQCRQECVWMTLQFIYSWSDLMCMIKNRIHHFLFEGFCTRALQKRFYSRIALPLLQGVYDAFYANAYRTPEKIQKGDKYLTAIKAAAAVCTNCHAYMKFREDIVELMNEEDFPGCRQIIESINRNLQSVNASKPVEMFTDYQEPVNLEMKKRFLVTELIFVSMRDVEVDHSKYQNLQFIMVRNIPGIVVSYFEREDGIVRTPSLDVNWMGVISTDNISLFQGIVSVWKKYLTRDVVKDDPPESIPDKVPTPKRQLKSVVIKRPESESQDVRYKGNVSRPVSRTSSTTSGGARPKTYAPVHSTQPSGWINPVAERRSDVQQRHVYEQVKPMMRLETIPFIDVLLHQQKIRSRSEFFDYYLRCNIMGCDSGLHPISPHLLRDKRKKDNWDYWRTDIRKYPFYMPRENFPVFPLVFNDQPCEISFFNVYNDCVTLNPESMTNGMHWISHLEVKNQLPQPETLIGQFPVLRWLTDELQVMYIVRSNHVPMPDPRLTSIESSRITLNRQERSILRDYQTGQGLIHELAKVERQTFDFTSFSEYSKHVAHAGKSCSVARYPSEEDWKSRCSHLRKKHVEQMRRLYPAIAEKSLANMRY